MSGYTLYFSPGACSRVSLIALEEIGTPFETRVLRFMAGEHRSPAYLAQNPKGKVPLLLIDGEPLTETVAILTWLDGRHPQARLLPRGTDALARAHVLEQLVWCTAGLHPIITRIRLPQMFCDHAEGRERLRQLSMEAMAPNFAIIEGRLAQSEWALGEWSMLDAYYYWVWYRTCVGSEFDARPYPHYAAHARRVEQRPSVQRALQREQAAMAGLAAAGLAPKMGPLSVGGTTAG
jgi:glutathione S-transferase